LFLRSLQDTSLRAKDTIIQPRGLELFFTIYAQDFVNRLDFMTTVISCTNRNDSNSIKIARHYVELLKTQDVEVQLLSLGDLPTNFVFSECYGNRTEEYAALIEQYVTRAEKFIFIVPEYNGSFPGIVKAFIDSVPPDSFYDKKAALVGLSAGHSGSLLGMDHLTGILNYLKVDVLSRKPKLSFIEKCFAEDGAYTDERGQSQLQEQVEFFLKF
jgi:chromate reductase